MLSVELFEMECVAISSLRSRCHQFFFFNKKKCEYLLYFLFVEPLEWHCSDEMIYILVACIWKLFVHLFSHHTLFSSLIYCLLNCCEPPSAAPPFLLKKKRLAQNNVNVTNQRRLKTCQVYKNESNKQKGPTFCMSFRGRGWHYSCLSQLFPESGAWEIGTPRPVFEHPLCTNLEPATVSTILISLIHITFDVFLSSRRLKINIWDGLIWMWAYFGKGGLPFTLEGEDGTGKVGGKARQLLMKFPTITMVYANFQDRWTPVLGIIRQSLCFYGAPVIANYYSAQHGSDIGGFVIKRLFSALVK